MVLEALTKLFATIGKVFSAPVEGLKNLFSDPLTLICTIIVLILVLHLLNMFQSGIFNGFAGSLLIAISILIGCAIISANLSSSPVSTLTSVLISHFTHSNEDVNKEGTNSNFFDFLPDETTKPEKSKKTENSKKTDKDEEAVSSELIQNEDNKTENKDDDADTKNLEDIQKKILSKFQ